MQVYCKILTLNFGENYFVFKNTAKKNLHFVHLKTKFNIAGNY